MDMGVDGVAELVIDELKQLVRLTHLTDSWLAVEDVKRINAELAALVADAAKRFGKIRVLADVRKLSPQPPEVVQHFDTPQQVLRTPTDRYAMVMGSTISKMQARRIMGQDDRLGFFLSINDAEDWLCGNRTGGEGGAKAGDSA